jgi:hypothetical protein
VGPRAGLEAVSKRKIPSPCWEYKPDHPIVQPVASRYTDRAIQFFLTQNTSFFGQASEFS